MDKLIRRSKNVFMNQTTGEEVKLTTTDINRVMELEEKEYRVNVAHVLE